MIKRLYYGIARRLRRLKGDWRKPVIEGRAGVPIVRPAMLDTLPHDPEAFTQGLTYKAGYLYESTGLYGESSLRKMSPDGKILQRINIPEVFAEGITISNDELVLLTWREGKALRYWFPDLEEKGYYDYSGQGGGLTSDQNHFIMSNGSGILFIRDKNFKTIRKLRVKLDAKNTDRLNALEYLDGKIYANIFGNNFILEIDYESGNALRIIDCSELFRIEKPEFPDRVLNGIAYCKDGDFFYLTGKKWKNIFRIKIP
ncbi:MAG: glutaminyl-peptide cyclotransferase [Smithella sp.]